MPVPLSIPSVPFGEKGADNPPHITQNMVQLPPFPGIVKKVKAASNKVLSPEKLPLMPNPFNPLKEDWGDLSPDEADYAGELPLPPAKVISAEVDYSIARSSIYLPQELPMSKKYSLVADPRLCADPIPDTRIPRTALRNVTPPRNR